DHTFCSTKPVLLDTAIALLSFPTRRASDLRDDGLHLEAAAAPRRRGQPAALGVRGADGQLHPRRVQGAVRDRGVRRGLRAHRDQDRKSTRLNSSHVKISYAVFCLKKEKFNC